MPKTFIWQTFFFMLHSCGSSSHQNGIHILTSQYLRAVYTQSVLAMLNARQHLGNMMMSGPNSLPLYTVGTSGPAATRISFATALHSMQLELTAVSAINDVHENVLMFVYTANARHEPAAFGWNNSALSRRVQCMQLLSS